MTYPATSAVCLVCGAPHAACGQAADVTPVDIPTVETRMPSDLRLYDVVVNGYETRMRLDDTDAARLNATPVDETRAVPEPTDVETPEPTRKARARVPNKARTADETK